MRISLKIIIHLMTGNRGERVDINYGDDITPVALNHRMGETAQIECTYPDSHENYEKFLCKGENPSNCDQLISTTAEERNVLKGRFDIRDNKRKKYFYVYINNLSTGDSGPYWCGSTRTGEHVGYTKFLLYVEDQKTRRLDLPALQTTESPTTRKVLHTDLIAVVVVSLPLLLILVLVFILCKHRLPRIQVCCSAGDHQGRGQTMNITQRKIMETTTMTRYRC
ncbi:CMRF35-like molecule 5 isoform X2 [Anoplopoma fimbria]|uniref:CMRF35-like molecule 5 isoform X2 n=1 Tax=Anoplopoma fimbria TaxID=229290 RepID=UPI0023ED0A91|nr:CMRF35-like molecule 5 isoform X2 [Anoplopoma fimbria]